MRGSRARRTVRPPKPESKTPMVGDLVGGCVWVVVLWVILPSRAFEYDGFGSLLLGVCGWSGVSGGVGCGIGAEEVGVAGEGVVGLAVDEEADGGDLG